MVTKRSFTNKTKRNENENENETKRTKRNETNWSQASERPTPRRDYHWAGTVIGWSSYSTIRAGVEQGGHAARGRAGEGRGGCAWRGAQGAGWGSKGLHGPENYLIRASRAKNKRNLMVKSVFAQVLKQLVKTPKKTLATNETDKIVWRI